MTYDVLNFQCGYRLPSKELKAQTRDVVMDIVRMELNKEYRMRIQNEDAALSADVKRDASLDRWRTMHERLRLSALHADRSTLLAAYCGLFRHFLPELLQVCSSMHGCFSVNYVLLLQEKYTWLVPCIASSSLSNM